MKIRSGFLQRSVWKSLISWARSCVWKLTDASAMRILLCFPLSLPASHSLKFGGLLGEFLDFAKVRYTCERTMLGSALFSSEVGASLHSSKGLSSPSKRFGIWPKRKCSQSNDSVQ